MGLLWVLRGIVVRVRLETVWAKPAVIADEDQSRLLNAGRQRRVDFQEAGRRVQALAER